MLLLQLLYVVLFDRSITVRVRDTKTRNTERIFSLSNRIVISEHRVGVFVSGVFKKSDIFPRHL